MNFATFGGRTYALTVGCGAVTSLMRCIDKLDNPTYGLIITSSVCAYIAATAVKAHTEIRAGVQKSIAAAQADSPPSVVEQVEK
ncbi:MAG: hypothetical protein ABIR92_10310 [Gemmatimonadaceae bacterium]